MSATMGTEAARTIWRSAFVDSSSGQETRTMSAPASSAGADLAMVASASEVTVLVMVCTAIVGVATHQNIANPDLAWTCGGRCRDRGGRSWGDPHSRFVWFVRQVSLRLH